MVAQHGMAAAHAAVLAVAALAILQGIDAAPWNLPKVPHPRMARHLWEGGDATISGAAGDAGSAAASPPWTHYNQTTEWFEGARLDHFNDTDARTWRQRYFVIDDFWAKPDGPVILHICGEYTCPGLIPTRLFPLELASLHGALVVSVEHRFFGESQPLTPLSVDNLAFQNSKQALADLAHFTAWFQATQVEAKWGSKGGNTWINIGGSYPGALSAWYRLKFPQFTAGALSASGVVNAILNYTQFDEQVATSVGPTCADTLRSITAAIEQAMPGVKAKFQASELDDGDFLYLAADAAAESVQYGHHTVLCDSITPPYPSGTTAVDAYADFVINFFYKGMGNAASDYDSKLMADPVNGGNGRSWWWFKCTSVGFWQVAPEKGSIRSQRVNYEYHQSVCKELFGLDSPPNVDGVNEYYGGADWSGSNVYFSNGVEDPWKWAGVRKNRGPTVPANVVNCDGCAHCVDLYTPASTDAQELVDDRTAVKAAVAQWLGDAKKH